MTPETRDYINRLAENIIEQYQIDLSTDNIYHVVRKLGGVVFEQNVVVFDKYHNIFVSKTDEDSFAILIPKNRPDDLKKECIIIALGYVFLTMGFKTNSHQWDEQPMFEFMNKSSTVRTAMAFEFMDALTMPEKIFRKVISENTDDNGIINFNKVASYFHCNSFQIQHRAKYFGLC